MTIEQRGLLETVIATIDALPDADDRRRARVLRSILSWSKPCLDCGDTRDYYMVTQHLIEAGLNPDQCCCGKCLVLRLGRPLKLMRVHGHPVELQRRSHTMRPRTPISKLQPHPDNPRLFIREEVVSAICEQINQTPRLPVGFRYLTRVNPTRQHAFFQDPQG